LARSSYLPAGLKVLWPGACLIDANRGITMHIRSRLLAATTSLLAGLLAVAPALGAESYDNCTGTISTLPVTISSQGVWCLKGDLSTTITSGNAITIAANNVTIDCNDFKLGGLAAGPASTVRGIYALNRQNATVRHCNVRGFKEGVFLELGAGHLVEDNRLDSNLRVGIWVTGDNNVVRRNRVFDTGGATASSQSYGIYASGNVDDNIVSGLFVDLGGGSMYGIAGTGSNTRVSGNVVTDFDITPTGGGGVTIRGIAGNAAYVAMSGNHVVSGSASASGIGIGGGATSFCKDNVVAGFSLNVGTCVSGGNLTPP
jgi:parallel beta-helix repeat protein